MTHYVESTPLTAVFDRWTRPSYEIRVRGTQAEPMYLWGSAGITYSMNFEKPLTLHVRNNVFGEVINLGMMVAGKQATLGSLQPGECISIPVQGTSSGVYAWVKPGSLVEEFVVACLIRE